MPTYVYKCGECEHMFETRQRMSEDPLTDCPQCDASALRRVINNVGIVFKGSGFYVTDNRNGKNGVVSSNGSSAATTETNKADAKADNATSSDSAAAKEKPAPKSESSVAASEKSK